MASKIDENPKPESSSLQHVQFIDIQWLSTFGVNKLSALDYFYTSPFFDQSSNNQRIRIQGVDASRRNDILISMTGLEFMLDEALTHEPNLYVIRKQNRKGPLAVELIDVYYIADGMIFQAPGFYELLRSRLNKISLHTSEAFDLANEAIRYATSDGTTNDTSANGTFKCWQSSSEESDGGTATATTTKNVKAVSGEMVLRDFPTFKTIILDAAAPTFQA